MSFSSFLATVGKDFENGLNVVLGDISKIATAEAPVLAGINPAAGAIATQIASLSTQAQAIVLQTEQKFAAMGKQTGTGVQKAAEAISILAPAVAQVLGLAGQSLSATTAALINGAVAILNALPASLVPGTPAAPATPPAAPTA